MNEITTVSLSVSFRYEGSGSSLIGCFWGWVGARGCEVTDAAGATDNKANNGAGSPGGRGRCFLLGWSQQQSEISDENVKKWS